MAAAERGKGATAQTSAGKTQSQKQSQNDYLNLIVFYLCQPWHLFSQMDLLGAHTAQATAYLWTPWLSLSSSLSPSLPMPPSRVCASFRAAFFRLSEPERRK